MDCAEGEDVNLPCNHSTIGRNDYIHWYWQNPNQSPQYVIHGLRDIVNSSLASLTIASYRKYSTLVLPQVTLRGTAVYYCVLRGAQWDRLGYTCTAALVGRRGDTVGEQSREKSRVIWKESQRAARDEENEGRLKGRRWIKKRRKGRGRSVSLVAVSEKNYGNTKNPNCNIERK